MSTPFTRPRTVGPSRGAPSVLMLVHLGGGDTFVFEWFPETVEITGRANWKPQPVVKRPAPLLYAGREPQEVNFPSVWLDNSAAGESVTPDVVRLLALQEVAEGQGAPPALLARWGDNSFRCVLADARVVERHFTAEGQPLRAELSLRLVELQEEEPDPPPRRNEGSTFTF